MIRIVRAQTLRDLREDLDAAEAGVETFQTEAERYNDERIEADARADAAQEQQTEVREALATAEQDVKELRQELAAARNAGRAIAEALIDTPAEDAVRRVAGVLLRYAEALALPPQVTAAAFTSHRSS